MAKMALCIKRADAPFNYGMNGGEAACVDHGGGFWHTNTHLVSRDICETDETRLQLIPYVVLLSAGPDDPLDLGRVFTYCRGKGGEEARLHGALSVGLGGHVDADVPADQGLREWLATEARRELREEVGLDVDAGRVVFADAVICNDGDAVGRVHIGLLAGVSANPEDLGASEVGVIEGSRWLTLAELTDPAVFDRLEPWSQAVVRYIGKQA